MSWEVRTMVSATSSSKFRGWFNPTLFRKNVTRFWPIWGIYTAILAFLLPVELLLSRSPVNARMLDVKGVLNVATVAMPVVGLVFGAITAMALFSYLMDHRAVQLYHSLPIRREGLFLTNWLTGLCFFLVPNLLLYLVSAVIELGAGALDLRGLSLWLVTATVCPMFFFCFTTCIAMFTGHILALPVFYGILNALVIGLCALMDFAGENLLYNYNGSFLSYSDPARWCTPVYQIIYLLTRGDSYIQLDSVMAASGYCVVLGAAFTVIALGVYRLRQLERAGDIVTVGWVRPVFQYGLGICVGLLCGLVLYVNFFYSFGPGVYILLTALCAVIGAFAGRMLLKKTLRVFAESWKGCFALGLAVLALMWGVRSDFTGFQRWTPDPAKVVSVSVYGVYTHPDDDGRHFDQNFDDPADIQRVVELHKALNADIDALRAFKENRGSYAGWEEEGQYQIMDTQYLRLSYAMADGSVVDRWYDPLPIRAEALDDLSTYAGQLNALLNDPEVVETAYWQYFWDSVTGDDLKATGGWITQAVTEEEYWEDLEISMESEEAAMLLQQPSSLVVRDTGSDDLTFTDAAAQAIWEAFQEDMAAGRVRRYLLDDRERQENCYISDINLSLSWTYVNKDGERSTQGRDFTFTPQKSQTSVMAALEKLGLKEALRERVYDYEPPVG